MTNPNNNKALFLDRDGTINIEKNYIYRIEDFEFTNGIIPLIKSYQKKEFLLFIITNQSGIARGYFTEKDFSTFTSWMLEQFEKEGISITKVYHCPHHPDFTGSCNCRKPNPGMILRAIKEYSIDPERSVLIGDKQSDIDAGKNAVIGTNLDIKSILGRFK